MFVSFLTVLTLAARASAQSPTDYAPSTGQQCPDVTTNPIVRTFTPQSQTLHPQEVEYISSRKSNVLPNEWQTWLGNGSAIGYNLSTFNGALPNVSIAISGGGYRASQYGAGVLSGLDARNASAAAAGTGGLLQVASYLSGLSGGSWLTGSLYMNNWPNISDMVFGNGAELGGWLLDLSLPDPNGANILDSNNQKFYNSLTQSIDAKRATGIEVSITDLWARMLSYHFLNGTSRSNFYDDDVAHGAGQFWSRISATAAYQQHAAPFPIIVTDSIQTNASDFTAVPSLQSVVYEVTPLEFGSWDPSLSAMANITYAGTHLTNGGPDNGTACVTGFDEAGYIIGTSSSLFNSILNEGSDTLNGNDKGDAQVLLQLIQKVFASIIGTNDVANWPNPFQSISASTFQDSSSLYLSMVDGGENLENVPLGPMFVKARDMDFVVAVDGSFDTTDTWPNGTSLLTTSERISTILTTSHQAFPPIPNSTADFVSTGVNRRPTFFGCDPTQNPPEWPLVLYLPNSPPINGSSPVTNSPTLKLSYTLEHTQLFLDQAHNTTISGFVPNKNTPDPNWGKCLQCGAIDRARYKTSPVTPRSDFCTTCFQQYCYNASNPPSQSELPGRNLTYFDPGTSTSVVGNSATGPTNGALERSTSLAVLVGAVSMGLFSILWVAFPV
ncbi:phospholipase B [Amylostereum chailletii]|nr:phospholipase B [Amylostereum chailletii]